MKNDNTLGLIDLLTRLFIEANIDFQTQYDKYHKSYFYKFYLSDVKTALEVLTFNKEIFEQYLDVFVKQSLSKDKKSLTVHIKDN